MCLAKLVPGALDVRRFRSAARALPAAASGRSARAASTTPAGGATSPGGASRTAVGCCPSGWGAAASACPWSEATAPGVRDRCPLPRLRRSSWAGLSALVIAVKCPPREVPLPVFFKERQAGRVTPQAQLHGYALGPDYVHVGPEAALRDPPAALLQLERRLAGCNPVARVPGAR